MTQVFIRCWAEHRTDIRRGMAIASIARWRMQADASLTILHTKSFTDFPNGCSVSTVSLYTKDFHIEAKKFSELMSVHPIYIVADDDCLILGKDFIENGVAAMDKYPEYGILSAVSISDGTPAEGNLIVDRPAVGGVAFIRRGILKEFPACNANQVDDTICQEFSRAGYKSGVIPWVKFNHLGAGYSLTSEGCWSA